MFNFISYTNPADGSTTAALCDENKAPIVGAEYMVFFDVSERRTRVRCQIQVGEEHKRLSVTRHVHRDGYIGSWANDVVCYQD